MGKMLVSKPAKLFTCSIAVRKEYLVCMVWPDSLSSRVFIAYSISACAWGYFDIGTADAWTEDFVAY